MSITTDFDILWTQKKQEDVAISVKAQLQNAMNTVAECKANIDKAIAGGTFNFIPATVVTALTKAYTVVDMANTSFLGDPDIQEVLTWAGK